MTAGYVYVDGLSVGGVGDIVLRDRRSLANDGMFMIVVTVDKQTGAVIGRPEIVTRGFVHLNERDPIMDEAVRAGHAGDRHAGRPHQRDRPAQEPDQGRRLERTCTSRRSADRWSSPWSSRSSPWRHDVPRLRARPRGRSTAVRAPRKRARARPGLGAVLTPEIVALHRGDGAAWRSAPSR
ncbi:MAG: hypothetical protein WKF78_15260 [Candidatus Limnocylindrales bacterium]